MSNLISFLQAWGIILVVIGHSFFGSDKSMLYNWIYAFHMPLFMFISGFLLQYTKRNIVSGKRMSIGKLLLKKAQRLLIPYITISTIAFFPKSLLSSFSARPVEMTFSSYLKMLIYPWDNVIIFFWFLPTLFLIFIAVYSTRKLCYYTNFNTDTTTVAIITSLVLLCLHLFNPIHISLFNIEGVINYLFYFVIGMYACRYGLDLIIQKKSEVIFISTFLLSLSALYSPSFLGKDVVQACNGIVMSIAMGFIYFKYNFLFLHHLFGASYIIYLYSWFPQVAFQQIFLKLTNAPWYYGSILAGISGLYFPYCLYKWMLKNKSSKTGRILSFISGTT